MFPFSNPFPKRICPPADRPRDDGGPISSLWPWLPTNEMPHSVCCSKQRPALFVVLHTGVVSLRYDHLLVLLWLDVWPAAETTQLESHFDPYPIIPKQINSLLFDEKRLMQCQAAQSAADCQTNMADFAPVIPSQVQMSREKTKNSSTKNKSQRRMPA